MKTSGPTLGPSLALALAGAALGIYGRVGLMASWSSADAAVPVGRMVIMFTGGAMFAVGAMMVLVVTVRPLFEKREADRIAEEIAEERRRQPGPGR